MTAGRILVALLDSGVTVGHPHLAGARLSGFSLEGDAPPLRRSADYADRTGHGTACAAALWRAEPRVDLLAVRLLDAELRATSAAVAAGIVAAAQQGARVIALSLGSRQAQARGPLAEAVAEAGGMGAICVAAAHPEGREVWPADLPGVISATTHRACPLRDLFRLDGPLPRYLACGWPRPIERQAPTGNLFGTSFAAVHVAARVAGLLADGRARTFREMVGALDALSRGRWGGPVGSGPGGVGESGASA